MLLYIAGREKKLGVVIIQEQRLQLGPNHYRALDLMILTVGKPAEQIITRPPLVCIEVLSPEDRVGRMLGKVTDYLSFGVPYVWVLDPQSKQAFAYTNRGMHEVKDGILRTGNPSIEVPLSEIFD